MNVALLKGLAKIFEEGDKALCMLEALSSIPALRPQGDVLLTDPGEINSAFSDFYIKLYSSESHTDKQ